MRTSRIPLSYALEQFEALQDMRGMLALSALNKQRDYQ